MKQLIGLHHVTAITSSAEKNYDFFTHVLGMRLVKKTINQDDIQTYHLFFADDRGNPGTDVTFFDFPGSAQAVRGANEISRIGLRVPSNEALVYWIKRFQHHHVKHSPIQTLFDAQVIFFEDFDAQRYALCSDENVSGVASGLPWQHGPVPNEYGITGLGPIFFEVTYPDQMDRVLREALMMRFVGNEGDRRLYEMGQGGHGARVIVEKSVSLQRAMQGYGGVHHVAFRIEDEDVLNAWIDRLNDLRAGHSGFVDRFYFKSLYTRLHPGILFEFATEGPGFIDDEEPYEILGERLALPPRFRTQRDHIETLVRPIDTVRSTRTFTKEYFD
jgi:glyoxalase family protein